MAKKPPPKPDKVKIAAMSPSLPRNKKAEALHSRAVKASKEKRG